MARHYGANHRQQHKRDSEIFGFYNSMRSYIESVLAFKMGSNTHHINVDDTVLFCSRLFAGCTAFFGIVTDLLETVVVLSCACVFSTQLGSIRRSPHETHVSILTAVWLRLLLLLPGLIFLCFYSFFFFHCVSYRCHAYLPRTIHAIQCGPLALPQWAWYAYAYICDGSSCTQSRRTFYDSFFPHSLVCVSHRCVSFAWSGGGQITPWPCICVCI